MYLAVDKENYYYQDKVVPLSFTEKVLSQVKPVGDGPQSVYTGVPLGTVLPFFGKVPPRGYRWCNGNNAENYPNGDNKFPQAAWVPDHLVGMPLPDMRENLIGGTGDVLKVGTPFNTGKLVVKGTTVKGASFKTPGDEAVSVAKESYLINSDGGGAKATMNARSAIFKNELPQLWAIKNQIGQTTGWVPVEPASAIHAVRGGKPLTDDHVIKDQTIELKLPETNPRHVMCRWIIRVE